MPNSMGDDRVFLHVVLTGDDDTQTRAVDLLAKAGQPVIRLAIDRIEQLGQVFFWRRWRPPSPAP